MAVRRPFKVFSPEEDVIWEMLYEKQLANVRKHASRLWLDGLDALNFHSDRVPNFIELSAKLRQLVNWELTSTEVIFSDGQDWFEHLAQRQFLVTEYIRSADVMDYTPLPDIWHDAFGHLPLMTNQRYADYVERFAHHALKYDKEERKSLGSLWWYTIEFGFIMEDGEMKALGAGLMSSPGELDHALSDEVEKIPYSLEAFENISPSPHAMHKTLFVLENFEQLEQSVEDWVAAHPK